MNPALRDNPIPQPLDYGHPAPRSVRLSWVTAAVAVALAAGCYWTELYCGTQEPFLGESDVADIFTLRVLPVSLVVAWCAWVTFVAVRIRPRALTAAFLALGLPAAVWCCWLTMRVNHRFESDRAQVAEWYRMAAEEEAARRPN